MKHSLLVAALILMTSCSANNEMKTLEKGDVLVSVNGEKLHQGILDALVRINPRVEAQVKDPQTKKRLVDSLIEQELMYQASLKQGLDKDPSILEKVALYKRVIIAQAYLESAIDKASLEIYEKNTDDEYLKLEAAHIQINFANSSKEFRDEKGRVKSEPVTQTQKDEALKKAQQVYTELKNGADFKELAKKYSDDKASQNNGGALGLIGRKEKKLERRGLAKISEVAFSLKADEFSEPVETAKGYHIVKVLTEAEKIPFDKVEKAIRFEIQKKVKDETLAQLKEKSKIEVIDASIKNVQTQKQNFQFKPEAQKPIPVINKDSHQHP